MLLPGALISVLYMYIMLPKQKKTLLITTPQHRTQFVNKTLSLFYSLYKEVNLELTTDNKILRVYINEYLKLESHLCS